MSSSATHRPGPVAVTGAGGFIGVRLLAALERRGIITTALLGPEGAAFAEPPAGTRSWCGDITDPTVVAQVVQGATTVVHLAGPASVAASFAQPVEWVSTHVVGTATLCEAAKLAGVTKVVLVSSAEVYGPVSGRVDEARPPAPRSPYGAAKVGAEAVVSAAVRRGDLQAVIVRPFSVYGPGVAAWSLIGTLADQAARGGPVRVRDPRPVRDLVHVDDVAAALVACVEHQPPEGEPSCFNLCSGVGHSVGELAELMARCAGVPVDHRPVPPDRSAGADIFELIGDPTRARLELGWCSTTELADGLSSLVAASQERTGVG